MGPQPSGEGWPPCRPKFDFLCCLPRREQNLPAIHQQRARLSALNLGRHGGRPSQGKQGHSSALVGPLAQVSFAKEQDLNLETSGLSAPQRLVRPNGYGSLPGFELPARTNNHENHPTQNRRNAEEHKEDAPGKTRADSAHTRCTGNIRRLLAAGTCHQRRCEIHPQKAKQCNQSEHKQSFIYFPLARKRLPSPQKSRVL